MRRKREVEFSPVHEGEPACSRGRGVAEDEEEEVSSSGTPVTDEVEEGCTRSSEAEPLDFTRTADDATRTR